MGKTNSTPAPPSPTPKPTPKPTTPWDTPNPSYAPTAPTASPTTSPTCQVEEDDIPQLRVTVADFEGAGTGSDVFARILVGHYGHKPAAEWTDWEWLNHVGCDTLDSQATSSYFNEFSQYDAPWLAIAVYNCGDDDVTVDSIAYWNGAENEDLEYWCPNVAGPLTTCGTGEPENIGVCFDGFETSAPHEYIRLDSTECHAMIVDTTRRSTEGFRIASPWFQSNPGSPDCSSLVLKKAEFGLDVVYDGVSPMITHAMSMEHAMIAVVLAIILMFVMVCAYFKKKYRHDMYKAIPEHGFMDDE